MKKTKWMFLIKLFIFSILLFTLLFGVVMPQFLTSYNAAMVDKVDRLATAGSPKIVIVGDSNVAFGIDSAKIQEAFGLPVVNMGLHAGLGQKFHTDMIKPYIGSGDVIILAPYTYTDSANIKDNTLAWLAIENHWKLWKGIAVSDYFDMCKAYPTYLKRATYYWATNTGNKEDSGNHSFKRSVFNEYGDNIFSRPVCVIPDGSTDFGFFNSEELSPELQNYWNTYSAYAEEQGAKLYMSCPPIFEDLLATDLSFIQVELEEKLNFPVISKLTDYVYPTYYFYDGGLHLTFRGKQIRTDRLIEDLAHYLPYSPAYANLSSDNNFLYQQEQKLPLRNETDIYKYLDYIDNSNYHILVSAKDDASFNIDDVIAGKLNKIGFTKDLRGKYRESYIGVIDSGNSIYEDIKNGQLEYSSNIDGMALKVISTGLETGNYASIIIDGQELSINKRGLNFVIYDKFLHEVVDYANFDTHDQLLCYRR